MSPTIKHIILLFVLLSFISCEEKRQWNTRESAPVIIVDALITNEKKNHPIFIYTSQKKLNTSPIAISNAIVKISGSNNEYIFSENPENPGEYISDSAFGASAGISYKLTVEYQDIFDTAEAELVAITPLEQMLVLPYEDYFRFHYIESTSPSMLELHYDWSGVPDFCTQYGSCFARETFYTLHNLDVNSIFAPDKQVIHFPEGTKLIRKKYSLSEEHQQFLRAVLMETEWRGGIFDVEPGNIPTNFRHGTRGWFATCMALSDSVIVE